MLRWFLLTSVLSLCLQSVFAAFPSRTELVLSHVLFRHGARTTYRFYPTDPYINCTFYPFGLGQLTNQGKMDEYRLGKYLKQEYKHFLGETYFKDLIDIRSTDRSRTKMSAQLVLAGMWPPTEEQKWHPKLNWQPIPVYSKQADEEDLLNPTNCKYRDFTLNDQQNRLDVKNKFINPYKETFDYIKDHSGFTVDHPVDALEFYFIVSTETEMKLTIPDWIKNIYPKPLKNIAAQAYGYWNYDENVRRINIGFFVKKIVDDFLSKINDTLRPRNRKMFLYSAHESNLGNAINAMNLTGPHVPPYSSAILFDLRKDDNNNHYVQIRYEDDLDKPPKVLNIPGCEILCPIKKFIEIYDNIMPKISYKEICSLPI